MRFFCLCMSPAIDATVALESAPRGEGEIFKEIVDVENVGGKAVNVARWLAIRGASVVCGGLLGAENAAPFERELATYGIVDAFLRVPGSTRRNEMLTWPGGCTKLNRAAFPNVPPVSATDVLGDVVVLSGSLPKCCSPTFYAECIALLRNKDVNVVLDASGKAFELGIAERPYLVKPNAEECAPVVGFVPKAPDDFARATEHLHRFSQHVIISDGAAGAWFDGEFVPAPPAEVVDTTAAGDTLLAEYCYRISIGDPDAARWAVAAGSAAVTMPGSRPPSPACVEQLKR